MRTQVAELDVVVLVVFLELVVLVDPGRGSCTQVMSGSRKTWSSTRRRARRGQAPQVGAQPVPPADPRP
ncbi:hypothetical protein [uncultured Pseudokineococcus sp.]|uniref:hypothetical protein n=1 Tax=uncultured Pseudokineococcus sp. TaxID=1642928 RepID=UPI00262F86F3|nr:hypothetical protein [uncultured Pseudokineococcus sp.]